MNRRLWRWAGNRFYDGATVLAWLSARLLPAANACWRRSAVSMQCRPCREQAGATREFGFGSHIRVDAPHWDDETLRTVVDRILREEREAILRNIQAR